METPCYPQVSLRLETTALQFPGYHVETQGNSNVTYRSVGHGKATLKSTLKFQASSPFNSLKHD